MKIEELETVKEQVEELREQIGSSMNEFHNFIGRIQVLLEKLDKEYEKLQREEFDIFIKHGFYIGAKFEFCSDNPVKLTVTGIVPTGFVLADENGKEYTVNGRHLKCIEKFKVTQ